MGKYINMLYTLREQRNDAQSCFDSMMGRYGSQMDDMYRQLNEQHHAMLMEDYDREIREVERRAQQEQIDEISKGVLANLSKEGSKAAKDIASELQKALNSIRL